MATGSPNTLTFFCELNAVELKELFSDPSVMQRLVALGARVSLGILDFSPQRATVARHLNRAGIPVIAWQLLPREHGYWYHMCNAAQAAARYTEFRDWSAREKLQWSGIGVDIEPDIGEFQALLTHKTRLFRKLLQRGFGTKRLCYARDAYRSLVLQMQSDGYRVYSYEFPFMADEQKAGSTLLCRLLGVTDVPADQQVLMLYTSFFRPYGPAFLWNYAKDAASVGVGSTGGGVQMEGVQHPPPLSWDEFSRDLRLCARRCEDIHIFSLEGCVQQGFLKPLQDFEWDQPMLRPPHTGAGILYTLRTLLRASLWLTARPVVLGALLICLIVLLAA